MKDKLATLFPAWEICVEINSRHMEKAVHCCDQLGLVAKTYAYQDGKVRFKVLVPHYREADKVFEKEMEYFDATILVKEETTLIGPPGLIG